MTHMQAPLWSAIGALGVERVRVHSMISPVCRISGMEALLGRDLLSASSDVRTCEDIAHPILFRSCAVVSCFPEVSVQKYIHKWKSANSSRRDNQKKIVLHHSCDSCDCGLRCCFFSPHRSCGVCHRFYYDGGSYHHVASLISNFKTS
jgi:hypothetical protein